MIFKRHDTVQNTGIVSWTLHSYKMSKVKFEKKQNN